MRLIEYLLFLFRQADQENDDRRGKLSKEIGEIFKFFPFWHSYCLVIDHLAFELLFGQSA